MKCKICKKELEVGQYNSLIAQNEQWGTIAKAICVCSSSCYYEGACG